MWSARNITDGEIEKIASFLGVSFYSLRNNKGSAFTIVFIHQKKQKKVASIGEKCSSTDIFAVKYWFYLAPKMQHPILSEIALKNYIFIYVWILTYKWESPAPGKLNCNIMSDDKLNV